MVCLRQIVSVRKPTLDQYRHFSTGGSLVAGRFLDSNEVNNVKDSFLPCEAPALFQQVTNLTSATSSRAALSKSKNISGTVIMCPMKMKTARSASAPWTTPLHLFMPSYRNLFAIDYMQEHPKTTTGEFALVYDALNQTTKEVRIPFHGFYLLL